MSEETVEHIRYDSQSIINPCIIIIFPSIYYFLLKKRFCFSKLNKHTYIRIDNIFLSHLRYFDQGNRKHFDLLPPELAARWIEGRAKNGQILPGMTD